MARKIKHWAGYGTVRAEKVNDVSRGLHVRIVGDHEQGLRPRWNDTAYDWLVHRFDRKAPERYDPTRMGVMYHEGFTKEPNEYGCYNEQCDICFFY